MGKTSKSADWVEMLASTTSKLTPYIAILTVVTVILGYILISTHSTVTSGLLNPSRFATVTTNQGWGYQFTSLDLVGIFLITIASTVASYLMVERMGPSVYENYVYEWTA